MPVLSRPCVLSHPKAGFSLIATAVLLTVAALIFVSVLPSGQDNNQKIIETVHKFERIDEAMRSYMAAHGHRPCPADGQYAVNTANFGVEAANPGSCQGGTPSAPLGPDSSGNLVGGTIPTKTLGLPDDYAIDAFGHRFTYIVDIRATRNSFCFTLTQGGITIESAGGGTVLGHTMYVYISHGRTGDGAWPMQGGASRINTGNNNVDMGIDAAYGGSNWLNNGGVLVQQAAANGFDDIVWYRPDQANVCAIGPYAAPGHCNTAAPNGPLDSTFSPATLPGTPPGSSMTAYATPSGACTPHTLACTNGQLKCDNDPLNLMPCKYWNCSSMNCATAGPPPLTNTGPLDPSFTPTSMHVGDPPIKAYPNPTDITCTPSYTVSCTNVGGTGTLSCSTGGTSNLNDCKYSGCNPTGCNTSGLTGFPNPMSSGTSMTVYVAANDPSCTPHILTCNNGTLTCDGSSTLTPNCQNNIATCAQECPTAAPSGPLDSSFTPTSMNNGGTHDAYVAASDPTCTKYTVSCSGNLTSHSLSCSTGGSTLTDCMFSSCTVSGASCTTPWGDTLNSGNSVSAYNTDLVTPPATCPAANTLTCNNGTLTCMLAGGGSGVVTTDCKYSNCCSHGRIWVSDTNNHRIQEFDTSGNFKRTCGTPGNGDGDFDHPHGIAIDPITGDVWVADRDNHRIEKFDCDCNWKKTCGSQGGGDGFFQTPMGIFVDSSENVWIADTGNNRVQEIDHNDCHWKHSYYDGGSLNGDEDVDIDSGSHIWVADTGNSKIREIDPSTDTEIGEYGGYGIGFGQFANPAGLNVDSSGNIWVADTGNNRIEERDNGTGTWQMVYVLPPSNFLNFLIPDAYALHTCMGMIPAVCPAQSGIGWVVSPGSVIPDGSGHIVVADTGNNRIQVLNPGLYTSVLQIPASPPAPACNPSPPCNTGSSANGYFDTPSYVVIAP